MHIKLRRAKSYVSKIWGCFSDLEELLAVALVLPPKAASKQSYSNIIPKSKRAKVIKQLGVLKYPLLH